MVFQIDVGIACRVYCKKPLHFETQAGSRRIYRSSLETVPTTHEKDRDILVFLYKRKITNMGV